MLVVKIEVWPGGFPDQAFEISRVGLANISNLAEVSNYEMTALLAREKEEHVIKGEVNSHQRELGWAPLVQRAMTGLFLHDRLSRPGDYDDPVAQLLRKGHRV